MTYTYYDSNGQQQAVTLNYGVIPVYNPGLYIQSTSQLIGCSAPGLRVEMMNLPVSIIYPNGTSYTFQYEQTYGQNLTTWDNQSFSGNYSSGRIAKLTLPTGASVSYTYTANDTGKCDPTSVLQMTRTTQDGTWAYSKTYPIAGNAYFWRSPTTTITEPPTAVLSHGATKVYTFISDLNGVAATAESREYFLTSMSVYPGAAQGTPLAYTQVCYDGYPLPCTSEAGDESGGADVFRGTTGVFNLLSTDTYVSLNGAAPHRTTTQYASGLYLPTEKDEYDSTGQNVVRKTLINYLTANGLTMNKPASKTIEDGSSNIASQVIYGYDEVAVAGTSGIVQHMPVSGQRANLTSVSAWRNTDGAWLKTKSTYDDTGQMISTADANGNLSTLFSYSDSWARNSGTCATSGSTNAFLTQTTDPLGHISRKSYDACMGLVAAEQDPNDIANGRAGTTYLYDEMNAPLSVGYPDGGTITYNYNNYALPLTVSATQTATPDPSTVRTTVKDGFGRDAQLQFKSVSGNTIYYVDEAYDLHGNLSNVSNPYGAASDETYGTTTYTRDALDRVTLQVNPDGTSRKSTYLNNVTTITDEDSNNWQQTTDQLGRLVGVVEPGSLQTNYTYDLLDNLTNINQLGLASESPRTRAFSYDSLSRLVAACNPEGLPAGQACDGTDWSSSYGYDPNGNVSSKTDARGITTNLYYDALNRVYLKTYSDGVTLPVSYSYDTTPGTTCAACNTIGQLTRETVSNGSSVVSQRSPYAYDAMGRVQQIVMCAPANCATGNTLYHAAYNYDLAGNVIASTNGIANTDFTNNLYTWNPWPLSTAFGSTGVTLNGNVVPSVLFSMTYDGVGRLSTMSSSWSDALAHPANIITTSLYNPAGGLANAVVGLNAQTNLTTASISRHYDNRLRLVAESDSGLGGTGATSSSGNITLAGTEQQFVSNGTPGTGYIEFGGGDGGGTGICRPHTICTPPDSGTISVTINSPATGTTFTASVNYNGEDETTFANEIATALASPDASGNNPLVNGTVGSCSSSLLGNYSENCILLTLTSLISGSASDYPFSVNISGPDYPFWDSGAALTGGTDPGTIVYDAGSISVGVLDTTATATWQAGSTLQSIVNQLSPELQSAGAVVTQSGSGASITLNLSSIATGTAANLPVTCTAYDTASQASSFSVSCNGMTGGTNPSGSFYYGYSVGHWPNGNVSSVNDTVTGLWSYQYDALNRLTTANGTSGTFGNGVGVAGINLGWTYDSFGNRTAQTTNSGLMPSVSAQYGTANNQITTLNNGSTTFTYDASGEVTWDGVTHYLYDAEGRICALSSGTGGYIQYVYDGDGKRVSKGTVNSLSCNMSTNGFSQTNAYIHGATGELLSEIKVGGAWDHSNAYALGQLLATYHDTNTYFAFNDWLGSKRIELSAAGCLETYSNLPFGDALTAVGSCQDATEQHFTGKERDTESGNDYFGARYYGSSMGRFMSPDPLGIASGNLSNPQSLNLYSYVLNNPLVSTDPSGMECVWDDGSYDDNDDPDTGLKPDGSHPGCEGAGGTWVDHSYFAGTGMADWSPNANPNLTCGGISTPTPAFPGLIDYATTAQSNAAAYRQNPLSWYGAFKGGGTQDFKNTTNFPSPAYGDGANRQAVGNFNFGASVAAAGLPLSTGQFWAGAGAMVSNLGAQASFSMSQAGYMNGQYGGPSAPSPLPQAPPWTMGPGFPGAPVMGPDGVMNQGDQTWPTESRAVATGFLWESLGCTQ